jgi:hypothetical protein
LGKQTLRLQYFKDLSQAEKEFLEATKDPSTRADAQYQLSLIHISLNHWERAEANIRQFLEARPSSNGDPHE